MDLSSQTADLLLLVCLLVTSVLHVQASDASCPRVCVCRTRRVPKLGQTYFVNCKARRFTKVPDLSSLKSNELPKRLDLSRNIIQSISKSDFPSGLNIAMMFLGENENLDMADSALVNLADSLEFLDLQSIHLQFVAPFTFLRGLTKLKKLILNYNSQRFDGVISSNIFYGFGLTSLREITMYNCRIGRMDEQVFTGIENLQELDLTFNVLREIPTAIRQLKKLNKLFLRHNHIDIIHRGSFQGMDTLSDLVLNDNEGLSLIRGSLGGLEDSLKTLSMNSCDLDDVPREGISPLRALEILKLAFNPLSKMSSTSLEGSYCLKSLDLSKTIVPLQVKMLEPQKNCLVTIYLNDRSLTEIPTEFLSGLPKLSHVFLNNNHISVLEAGSFTGVSARAYEFNDNPLVAIEQGAFADISRGLSLSLMRTKITDLHFMLDYKDKTFQHVWLEGTNITCDCSLYEASQKAEPWTLEGQCSLRNERKDLKDYEFKIFLKDNCTVVADENSKYVVNEEDVTGQSVIESMSAQNHYELVSLFVCCLMSIYGQVNHYV